MQTLTLHASALLVGPRAVLIRGGSGSGKSSLLSRLLGHSAFHFTRLIGDDRIILSRHHTSLIAAPHPAIAGLYERRGLGVVRQDYEPQGVVMLDILLSDQGGERLPEPDESHYLGVRLPLLHVGSSRAADEIVRLHLQKNMQF